MSDTLEQTPSAEAEGKHRRLVPQFSLNNRAEQKQAHHGDAAKKPVTRYTREQLIALRRTSSLLPSMRPMSEIVSLESQEPVCFTKLEPEDVIRLWNAATKDTTGRGRGRARLSRENDDQLDHQAFDGLSSNADLWDDAGLAGDVKDFDLSEISKASLQFRNDMENIKLGSDIEISAKEVDTMEILMEQQQVSSIPQKQEVEPVKITTPKADKLEEKPLIDLPLLTSKSSTIESVAQVDLPLSSFLKTTTEENKSLKTDHNSNSFLKTIVGDPFLPSISAATGNPLLAPFSVNNFFQSDPILYTAPPPPVEPEWFYTDPQRQVQGPFTQENMRLWNEAGYFGKDLPIKLRQWSDFHLFKDVFPDPRLAFYSVPQEPVRQTLHSNFPFLPLQASGNSLITENIQRNVRLDFSREPISSLHEKSSFVLGNDSMLRAVMVEQPRATENSKIFDPLQTANQLNTSLPQALSKIEISGDAPKSDKVDPPLQASKTNSVDKSDYAKQILGISKKSDPLVPEKASPLPSVPLSAPIKEQSNKGTKENNKTTPEKPKGWKTDNSPKPVNFLDIQQEAVEEHKTLNNKPTPSSTSTATTPPAAPTAQLKSLLGLKPASAPTPSIPAVKTTKTAWSAPVTEVQSIPLKDIMKEEITQQQKREENGNEKVRGSTWASKISSNSVGSSPAPPPMHSTSSIHKSSAVPAPPAVASVEKVSSLSSQISSRTAAKASDKSDFGGKRMSKELADWCGTQLKVIKGIEDLTLMEFCMSLNSAAEIRETLSSYLGSSPQVTNFATEFIKFKEEGRVPARALTAESQGGNSSKKKKSVK